MTLGHDIWVFGYGSLMWRPGFAHAETRLARMHGFHRALCVRSCVHRGTPERPGLVLGLDRGGSCRGLAFRVPAEDVEEARAYLRARELVTHVYREVERPVRLEGGSEVLALAYVVDRRHPQYAGHLSTADAVGSVSGAMGKSGANEDYVLNTVAHLRLLGLRDHRLEAIAAELNRQSQTHERDAAAG